MIVPYRDVYEVSVGPWLYHRDYNKVVFMVVPTSHTEDIITVRRKQEDWRKYIWDISREYTGLFQGVIVTCNQLGWVIYGPSCHTC